MKSYNEKGKEGYFLEVDIQYPENLHKAQNNLPEIKLKVLKDLLLIYMIKMKMLFA